MRVGKVTIRNFARIKEMVIDFSQPLFHQIKGVNEDTGQSNETGKSTILNALSWCFYGTYPATTMKVGDEVINPLVGKNCMVAAELLGDNETHIVTRMQKYDVYKNALKIVQYENGSSASEEVYDLGPKNKDAAQKAIEDIIGMDYQTFLRSHYFAQEGVEAFGAMTDSELKNFFLNKLLDLSWIKSAHELAKQDLSKQEENLRSIQYAIKINEDKYHESLERIGGYQERNEEWLVKHNEELLSIKNELKELKDQKDVIVQNKEKIEKKIKELSVALSMVNDGMDWKSVIAKIDGKMNPLLSQIGQYENTLSRCERSYKELRNKLIEVKNMKGEQCVECGTTITKEHLPHLTMRYKLLLRPVAKEYREAKKGIVGLNNQLKTFRMEKEAIVIKMENNQSKQGEYKELKSRMEALAEMTDTKQINKDIEKSKENYEKKKSEISPFLEMIRGEKEKSREYEQKINQDKKGEESLLKVIKDIQFWVKAFSSQGIQSFILDSVTKVINRYIAEYLLDLSDGRIMASFDTVNKLKSGEWKEKFRLNINNMDGGASYATLSGGAKKRVDLAVALAVSRFKRSLSNKELELLILDESTSGIDNYWTTKVLEMLVEKFRGYSVFFVTHQEVEEFWFDKVITVRKRNGETLLEEN